MGTENFPLEVLPSPSLREWMLWLMHRRLRLRVIGDSMQPTLETGDLVLVTKGVYGTNLPRLGDIVVAYHPYRKNFPIIKRIAAMTPDGRVILHSDNPQLGSDSRQFGAIALDQVIGRVTGRMPA